MAPPLYTSRHYQNIATMLGDLGRTQSEPEWQRTLATAKWHLTDTNARMDWKRIMKWANDVRDGRRSAVDGSIGFTPIGKRTCADHHGKGE
jgi:hypothetical protein